MAADDWIPASAFEDVDEFEEDEYGGVVGNDITCRYCGAEHLDWVHTGVRWRLLDPNGKFHNCRNKPATADEFEGLE